MATATEMTLTLGRTVYGGDPSEEAQSDERIEGRETRMSVTWRLTEDEQNLPLMASLLAEEAVRALGAADRTVCRNSQFEPSEPSSHSKDSSQNERTARTEAERMPAQHLPQTDLQTSRGAPQSDVPAGAGSRPTYGSNHYENGSGIYGSGTYENGNHSNGTAQIESKASAAGNGSGPAASSCSSRYIVPITKAQRLAIQSLCTRHGVADWELRRLVWEQFGKKEQGELSKEQAAELLAVLQQGSVKDEANNPAYAN